MAMDRRFRRVILTGTGGSPRMEVTVMRKGWKGWGPQPVEPNSLMSYLLCPCSHFRVFKVSTPGLSGRYATIIVNCVILWAKPTNLSQISLLPFLCPSLALKAIRITTIRTGFGGIFIFFFAKYPKFWRGGGKIPPERRLCWVQAWTASQSSIRQETLLAFNSRTRCWMKPVNS